MLMYDRDCVGDAARPAPNMSRPDRAHHTDMFRDRDDDAAAAVTNIELFFDLVFVFAITQLSHRLLSHFTGIGAVETLVLMTAVWWAWIDTGWATNWLDPDHPAVRVLMLGLMLVGLVMSSAIPNAFVHDAMNFALAYVAMQLGRTLFMLWALRQAKHDNLANFARIFVWLAIASVFWIAGAVVGHRSQLLLWGIAAAIECAGPALGFPVPALGRSQTTDWDVAGGHVAERCALFIIIALGEALLVTGQTFAIAAPTAAVTLAFVTAFAASAVMWWVYFDVGEKRGVKQIEQSADPGHIARIAYTYLHLPIVAGIVLTAVADAMLMAHPQAPSTGGFAACALGGGVAYLFGTAAFKLETSRMTRLPLSHIVGIVLLMAAIATLPVVNRTGLVALTVAALVVVAIWEALALRRNPELAEPDSAA